MLKIEKIYQVDGVYDFDSEEDANSFTTKVNEQLKTLENIGFAAAKEVENLYPFVFTPYNCNDNGGPEIIIENEDDLKYHSFNMVLSTYLDNEGNIELAVLERIPVIRHILNNEYAYGTLGIIVDTATDSKEWGPWYKMKED